MKDGLFFNNMENINNEEVVKSKAVAEFFMFASEFCLFIDKMAQNELALQFYSAGFFAPENADAAMACLDMMDFDRKDFVMQKVQVNGLLFQRLMMAQEMAMKMAMMLDQATGSQLAPAVMQQLGIQGGTAPGSALPGKAAADNLNALGGGNNGESSITRNARTRVAQSTAPR